MLKKIICLICAMLITSAFSIVSYGSEGAYTVNKVNYTYDDGSYAYAIVGGKTVQITAEITKNTSDNIPFVMFVVLYHNNNTLVGLQKSEAVTLQKGETMTLTVDYKLPSDVNSQNNYLKLLCWDGDSLPVIHSKLNWQEKTLEVKNTQIEETVHLTVKNKKRQTFKGAGTSYNSATMFQHDEGLEDLTKELFTSEGLGFNVLRLWGELISTSVSYDYETKELEFREGGKSFRRLYVDSGLIEKVERFTDDKAKIILTPATSLPAVFRESSATNVVLNEKNVIQTYKAGNETSVLYDIKSGGSIIFGGCNSDKTHTTVWVDVASKYGGKITLYNADNDKKLTDIEIKPTGGNDIFRTQGVAKKTAMSGVKNLRVQFEGNDADFGSIKEIVIDGNTIIKTSKIPQYAEMVADYVSILKADYNINIDYLTVFNEPLFHFTPEQLRTVVKEMRKALDKKGLANVKILADEWAEIDEFTLYAWEELLKDKEALDAIDGLSFHSYTTNSIGYYKNVEEIFKKAGKEIWMTESSDTDVLSTVPYGDIIQGSNQASRMLNDLNNYVEYWIHFLGTSNGKLGGGANATFLAGTDSSKEQKAYTRNGTYHYYNQILNAFDYGSVFRYCTTQEYGDMSRPRGKKPAINAAFVQNPDGSYAMGIANSTNERIISQGWGKQNENLRSIKQNVEIYIEELAGKTVEFEVVRSGKDGFSLSEGTVKAINGKLNITLSDCELVTLRSK